MLEMNCANQIANRPRFGTLLFDLSPVALDGLSDKAIEERAGNGVPSGVSSIELRPLKNAHVHFRAQIHPALCHAADGPQDLCRRGSLLEVPRGPDPSGLLGRDCLFAHQKHQEVRAGVLAPQAFGDVKAQPAAERKIDDGDAGPTHQPWGSPKGPAQRLLMVGSQCLARRQGGGPK